MTASATTHPPAVRCGHYPRFVGHCALCQAARIAAWQQQVRDAERIRRDGPR